MSTGVFQRGFETRHLQCLTDTWIQAKVLSTPLLLTAEFFLFVESHSNAYTEPWAFIWRRTHYTANYSRAMMVTMMGKKKKRAASLSPILVFLNGPQTAPPGHGSVHTKRKATHGEEVVTLRSEMSRKEGPPGENGATGERVEVSQLRGNHSFHFSAWPGEERAVGYAMATAKRSLKIRL